MSRDGVILVIDLGSQSLRGTVLNREGARLGGWSLPVLTRREGPLTEQDPREWGEGMERILREVGRQTEWASSLQAVAACGVLATAVPLGKNGQPLRRAILYSDTRPARWLSEIENSTTFRRVRHSAGWRPFAGDLLPQVLWLAREEPDVYRRSHRILDSTAYLNFLLTGAFSMDAYTRLSCYADPSAAELPLDLLYELGLDAARFGSPVPVGSVIGTLRPGLAAACGLPQCPVISVPYDSMTAYLGAGLRQEGDALDISGTVTSFGVAQPKPVIDPERRIYSIPLPENGGWLVRGSTAMAGGALEWARNTVFRAGFDELDLLVGSSPPGANGVLFLPFLAGERAPLWNPDARGVFFGLAASTTTGDLARAVYEGICFSLRHIQTVIESHGVGIGTVKLAGGLARNALLRRIKASVTGKTLMPFEDFELTTLGAASIAGRSIGWYCSAEEAATILLRTGEPVMPDDWETEIYSRQFALYLRLVEQLSPLFQPLDTFDPLPVR